MSDQTSEPMSDERLAECLQMFANVPHGNQAIIIFDAAALRDLMAEVVRLRLALHLLSEASLNVRHMNDTLFAHLRAENEQMREIVQTVAATIVDYRHNALVFSSEPGKRSAEVHRAARAWLAESREQQEEDGDDGR